MSPLLAAHVATLASTVGSRVGSTGGPAPWHPGLPFFLVGVVVTHLVGAIAVAIWLAISRR